MFVIQLGHVGMVADRILHHLVEEWLGDLADADEFPGYGPDFIPFLADLLQHALRVGLQVHFILAMGRA